LWFEDNGKTYYFCKASHLLRHLVEYYGKQGRTAVNTGKGVSKRGRKRSEETDNSKKNGKKSKKAEPARK
jgi:hypothetical protein